MALAVVIPAYNPGASLDSVLAQLPPGLMVYVVDDGSVPPVQASVRVLRHEKNRGYGAAQKTGYAAALADGAERIVMIHGDDQYSVPDTLMLADALDDADAAIGSRFLSDPNVIPWWRRLGNRMLTGLANVRFHAHHTELHSGARAFRAATLRRLDFERFSNDYLFDHQVLAAILNAGLHIAERPVRTRYDSTTQSISFRRSVRYGLGCLGTMIRPPALLD